MTDTRADTASIVERIRPVETGAPVVAIHFVDGTAFFVLGEESVLLTRSDGEPQRVAAHAGGILAAAAGDEDVFTAGDDGKVAAIAADGENSLALKTDGTMGAATPGATMAATAAK